METCKREGCADSAKFVVECGVGENNDTEVCNTHLADAVVSAQDRQRMESANNLQYGGPLYAVTVYPIIY